MSPDHTEKSASATAGRDSVDCDDDIIVDAEPRFVNCSQVANNAEFAPPPSEGASTVDEWQEFGEMSVDPQMPEPAGQPPLRCLDDEQVHLQRPGTLRLTDFEVKGTLGV